MEAYIQHKASDVGPFRTEKLDGFRSSNMPRSGLTVSGYGNNLPTPYEVRHNGKWKRVRAICYSNAATYFIRSKGEKLIVDFYDE
jgi:hypothetical protein